ncbi:hypothetical protein JCM10908_004450 [Rhodotorula pacifica]|uniref:uncharacterized protein n=1 Tax=Rhodotorula pacifica TaxID=1495444 RepID=UPI00316CC274
MSPYPTPSAASARQAGALLRRLAVSSLEYSPITARFYAERARSLEPLSEPAACLVAQCYLALDSPHEALWVLRQPVAFVPQATVSVSVRPQASTSSGRLIQPANECSVRCARLYAEACKRLRRHQEGRQVLALISRPGVTLAPALPLDGPPSQAGIVALTATIDETAQVDLEMARLAQCAGETERALLGFQKVLSRCPTCWEALEALCSLGSPPDISQLFPVGAPSGMPQRVERQSSQSTLIGVAHPTTVSQSGPQPLTPSQNVIVNAPVDYVHAVRARGDTYGNGMATPTDLPIKASNGTDFAVKGKGRDLAAVPPPLRRAYPGRLGDTRAVADQDDSFDTTFYPSTGTLSFAPVTHTTSIAVPNAGVAPTTATLARLQPAATGVKRTRAGTLAPASAHLSQTLSSNLDDEPQQPGQVPRRSARSDGKARRIDVPSVVPGGTMRRSSRLSSTIASQNDNGIQMTTTRSQTSHGSSRTVGALRDKKRSKATSGPSVLSDNITSDILPSHSASPAPASPGQLSTTPASREAADAVSCEEAANYVAAVLRGFALAAVCLSARRLPGVIDAIATLPAEQSRSAQAFAALANAHFDAMQYDEAARAFEQVRRCAPHRLDGMAVYSTSLWHLRRATALSLLAQELLAVAPEHATAWIASGNVFSNIEDHANALRCFRRAAQVDEDCVYAYTLSGHECVLLEEWERASGFFREAIRRDSRHYNAWFGLGNVYLKTGKTALAEYHFRKALELNSSNATLACCVGAVLEKLGRRADALIMYDKARDAAPDSSLVRFKRVRLLIRMHRHEAAQADLLALQRQAPTEPNVLYLLGQLYRNLGRRPEMLRLFSQAQDLEPRFASLIRQQIEQDGASGMEVDQASDTTSHE